MQRKTVTYASTLALIAVAVSGCKRLGALAPDPNQGETASVKIDTPVGAIDAKEYNRTVIEVRESASKDAFAPRGDGSTVVLRPGVEYDLRLKLVLDQKDAQGKLTQTLVVASSEAGSPQCGDVVRKKYNVGANSQQITLCKRPIPMPETRPEGNNTTQQTADVSIIPNVVEVKPSEVRLNASLADLDSVASPMSQLDKSTSANEADKKAASSIKSAIAEAKKLLGEMKAMKDFTVDFASKRDLVCTQLNNAQAETKKGSNGNVVGLFAMIETLLESSKLKAGCLNPAIMAQLGGGSNLHMYCFGTGDYSSVAFGSRVVENKLLYRVVGVSTKGESEAFDLVATAVSADGVSAKIDLRSEGLRKLTATLQLYPAGNLKIVNTTRQQDEFSSTGCSELESVDLALAAKSKN